MNNAITIKNKEMNNSIENIIKCWRRVPGKMIKCAGLTVPRNHKGNIWTPWSFSPRTRHLLYSSGSNQCSLFNHLLSFSRRCNRNLQWDFWQKYKNILVEVFQLQRHLKSTEVNPEETKMWTMVQFLEFLVKCDFY